MTEYMAAKFLEQHGVEILERNFHAGRRGEIDLIGRDQDTLVFIEVKYRSSAVCGLPQEAVTRTKQRTIIQVASYYLFTNHLSFSSRIRFDVVAIMPSDDQDKVMRVHWIRDAFSVDG